MKKLITLLFASMTLSLSAQTLLIQENFQNWTAQATSGVYSITKTITSGGQETFTSDKLIVQPSQSIGGAGTAAGNGNPSVGRVTIGSTNGYLELPTLPSVGKIQIKANIGTDQRTMKLQIKNTLGSFDDIPNSTIAVSKDVTALYEFEYEYATPTTIRVVTSNSSLNIWDLAVYSYEPSSLETTSIVPAENAEVLYSALDAATITFNKTISKGTGTITLSDGTNVENISLTNVTISDAVASIPLTLSADKSYTLTVPAGTFVAGAESSTAIIRHFTTIGSLANVNYLINENFDTKDLSSSNWDNVTSNTAFNTNNLFYKAGGAASLSIASNILQTVELPGAGSLVYWAKHSSSSNTTLDLVISADKGNTGTFTEIGRITKPTNTTFALQKIDIDYNGPIVIKMEVSGSGSTQIGLDNITLTPYKANKIPVIEDVYTAPRYPSESDAIKIIGKVTDADIETIQAQWGTDATLSGGTIALTLNGGVYESATIPSLDADQTLYYQIIATDASSVIKSSIYEIPIYKAYTNAENFNTNFTSLVTSGFSNVGPIVSNNVTYNFTAASRTTNTTKNIEGTTIVLEKLASEGSISADFTSLGSINFDVLQTSGTVTLAIYKNDASNEDNRIKTVTIAGTPGAVNTGDIEFNLSSSTRVIIKNLGGGQVSIDNLRWSSYTATTIKETQNSATPVSEQYYTITGVLVSPSATGFLIKKTTYDNGVIETTKIFKK